jgi:hypothetical protein
MAERWYLSEKGWDLAKWLDCLTVTDCQCQSRNNPGFDLSILWHSEMKYEGRQIKHCWIKFFKKQTNYRKQFVKLVKHESPNRVIRWTNFKSSGGPNRNAVPYPVCPVPKQLFEKIKNAQIIIRRHMECSDKQVRSSGIILAEINRKNLEHHAIYYFYFRHGTYSNLLSTYQPARWWNTKALRYICCVLFIVSVKVGIRSKNILTIIGIVLFNPNVYYVH